MKKIYSTVMMLAMMVAALSFTACGGDDDDEIDNGGGKGGKTLIVDGEAFYAVGCSAEQTRGNGMYLNIRAATNPEIPVSGHEFIVHIRPSRVSELSEGDVYDEDNMSVQTLRRFTDIVINTYRWRIIEGTITIRKITSMEMTISVDNIILKHKDTGVEHSISGTAVLNSGVYQNGVGLLSFEEAAK